MDTGETVELNKHTVVYVELKEHYRIGFANKQLLVV